MGADAFFVQFPHPGQEHDPATDDMPWNTGPHRRKFLVAHGRYLDGTDGVEDAELVLWGEWEPPSTVEQRWPIAGELPRVLHRPWWAEPDGDGPRANTDPWVFGPRMRYSNCRQAHGSNRTPTAMQWLGRGSVICFGSTIAGEFCLDTVFVVASATPWTPVDADHLEVDDAFRTCTLGALRRGRHADVGFTLYEGATHDDPVDGMFSFVPARRADADDPRFVRPAVTLEYVNPRSWQSTWGSRRPLPRAEVRDAWESVRHQVLAVGLVLAVQLDTPQRRDRALTVASADQEC